MKPVVSFWYGSEVYHLFFMGQLYKWIERLVGNKPSHQGHQSRVSCQAAMDVQDGEAEGTVGEAAKRSGSL